MEPEGYWLDMMRFYMYLDDTHWWAEAIDHSIFLRLRIGTTVIGRIFQTLVHVILHQLAPVSPCMPTTSSVLCALVV